MELVLLGEKSHSDDSGVVDGFEDLLHFTPSGSSIGSDVGSMFDLRVFQISLDLSR